MSYQGFGNSSNNNSSSASGNGNNNFSNNNNNYSNNNNNNNYSNNNNNNNNNSNNNKQQWVRAKRAVPSGLNSLPKHAIPRLPEHYAWGQDSNGALAPFRNTRKRSKSVDYLVEMNIFSDGRVGIRASMRDPKLGSHRQLLSIYMQVARSGSTYKGYRKYAMSTDDYSTSSQKYDRGHGQDHADGNKQTTSLRRNFVPENVDFNRGARNHLNQSLRRDQRRESRGGGNRKAIYIAKYDYSKNPDRTKDDTAIPIREQFFTQTTQGEQSYFDVPNQSGYPKSRKKVTVQQFKKPFSSFPMPNYRKPNNNNNNNNNNNSSSSNNNNNNFGSNNNNNYSNNNNNNFGNNNNNNFSNNNSGNNNNSSNNKKNNGNNNNSNTG